MILESTQDRNTPLARRCLDFNLREEPYVIGTRKYTYQYLVCLNYFLEIQDGEAAGEVCIYTYHKGNFKTGKQFNTFLKRRNRSIYDNRVDLFAMHRMNKKGDFWLTLGFSDPRDEGGIYVQSPDDTKRLQELNQIFKGGMETGDIQVVPEEPLQ